MEEEYYNSSIEDMEHLVRTEKLWEYFDDYFENDTVVRYLPYESRIDSISDMLQSNKLSYKNSHDLVVVWTSCMVVETPYNILRFRLFLRFVFLWKLLKLRKKHV
jgi:hypothetical protein